METKICRICGEDKPIADFGKNNRYKDGYDTRCKSCFNDYQKASYHVRKRTPKDGNPALADFPHVSSSMNCVLEATRGHSNIRKL